MIQIVGKDQKHIHTISCKNCASVLEYTRNEVKEQHGKDYSGGSDGCEYIWCPACNHKVVIKSW